MNDINKERRYLENALAKWIHTRGGIPISPRPDYERVSQMSDAEVRWRMAAIRDFHERWTMRVFYVIAFIAGGIVMWLLGL